MIGREVVNRVSDVSSNDMAELLIVSEVETKVSADVKELTYVITKHPGDKCDKCWKYSVSCSDGICPRCQSTL